MSKNTFKCEVGGKELILKSGDIASQANASVTARLGDTVVLATTVMRREPEEVVDFFPLIVDYEENFFASGKIKGSRFVKRKGRPTDEAILTSRLIDRSIRPFFPKDMLNDVQVVVTVLSYDQENDPDLAALVATCAALSISNIPFKGPLAGVRVARKGNEFLINPKVSEREESDLDVIISATKEKVVMLEASAKEIPEKQVLEAIEFGKKEVQKIINAIEKMQAELGKPKTEVTLLAQPPKLDKEVEGLTYTKIQEIFDKHNDNKEIENLLQEFKQEIVEKLIDKYIDGESAIKRALEKVVRRVTRENILKKDVRVDGRKMDEIRPVSCSVGILPRTHGSALFTRGETQILTVVTLGSKSDQLILDTMEETEKKKCYLHYYNFPPFSVGEVSPLRGPGRREIGHGALAEKGLVPVLPPQEEFPYMMLLNSEVLSSNGSTSMASICGSSLALMDAGVPIETAVAGIAMGLITDEDGNYKLLTDIQGREDGEGDMDFKIAGTEKGITAIQLDVKIAGLTHKMILEALERAKKARLEILAKMRKAISAPREKLSPYAPKVAAFIVPKEKISLVIGPGGSTINEIIDKTETQIEIDNDGSVSVSAKDEEGLSKAVEWIKSLTREVKVGEKFNGRVKKITDFGAFVEILPRQEGLVHISQLADRRIRRVEDIVRVGDVIPVIVIDIDREGRIVLSHKLAK